MILWECVGPCWCAVAFDTRLRLGYPTTLVSSAVFAVSSSTSLREITQPQSGIEGRYERGEFRSRSANRVVCSDLCARIFLC
jgi:hypothetical protein